MIKIVAKRDDNVLKVLAAECGVSFNALNKALRKKDIKINGKRTSENIKVKAGDEIIVYLEENKKELETIYEDDNILIVNKPSSIESAGENSVETDLQAKNKTLRACHRLDRNTEGLLIFSKNDKAHEILLEAFKKGNIKKNYTAWVSGVPKAKHADLTAYLFKDAKKSQVFVYDKKITGSLEIKTSYKILREVGGNSVLDIQIPTGRTHQIRAHLSFIGYPIIGDDKYGKTEVNKKYGIKKQCLTASGIAFDFAKNCALEYLNGKTFKITPRWSEIVK